MARGDSILGESCDGFADITAEVGWTLETRTQIGSISKQFAACVALVLADRGAITLDDSVASMIPGRPEQWNKVSVRQLLTHTSGMSHWGDLPGFDAAQPLDSAERLTRLLTAPLAGPPGRTWRYSSPGYIVLSAVLESAGQRPYAELVHEHIIDRLGLTRTTVGHGGGSDAAHGYKCGVPVTPWQLHTMPGTGDIWSSARDLARFLTALHGGGLLPEAVQPVLHDINVALGPLAEPSARIVTNGCGLGHFRGTIDGHFAYLHPGDNPGYQSLAAWLPETDTLVVALSHDEAEDIEQSVGELVRRAAN